MRGLIILACFFLVGATGCIYYQPAPPSGQPSLEQTTPQPTTSPSIVAFSITPAEITAGGASTLLWNVTEATSVSIDQGIGDVPAAGTMIISPATTTIYTISASNAAGSATKSAIVTVGAATTPPIPEPPIIITPLPIPFAVTSVTASVDPPSFTGLCPKVFNFYTVITANGPGSVTYQWEKSDGTFVPGLINFAAAGSQTVTSSWSVGTSYSGWQRVHVFSPNEVISNQANFTLTCTLVPLIPKIPLEPKIPIIPKFPFP